MTNTIIIIDHMVIIFTCGKIFSFNGSAKGTPAIIGNPWRP